jgi:hypothetical protein
MGQHVPPEAGAIILRHAAYERVEDRGALALPDPASETTGSNAANRARTTHVNQGDASTPGHYLSDASSRASRTAARGPREAPKPGAVVRLETVKTGR